MAFPFEVGKGDLRTLPRGLPFLPSLSWRHLGKEGEKYCLGDNSPWCFHVPVTTFVQDYLFKDVCVSKKPWKMKLCKAKTLAR